MAIAAPAAHAVTYNAVTDFSITNGNANGVWSYLGGSGLLTSTNNYNGVLSWTNGSLPNEASVTANPTNYDLNLSVVVPSDRLNLDPQGQSSVELLFTAPTTGLYHGSESIFGDDKYETAHIVQLMVNGSPVGGGVISSFGQEASFSGNLFLHAGDTVGIVVDTGEGGAINNLGTGVSATISLVPEPAAWALMLVGFGGIGAMLRRGRLGAPLAIT